MSLVLRLKKEFSLYSISISQQFMLSLLYIKISQIFCTKIFFCFYDLLEFYLILDVPRSNSFLNVQGEHFWYFFFFFVVSVTVEEIYCIKVNKLHFFFHIGPIEFSQTYLTKIFLVFFFLLQKTIER